jgi:hypothetical protein
VPSVLLKRTTFGCVVTGEDQTVTLGDEILVGNVAGSLAILDIFTSASSAPAGTTVPPLNFPINNAMALSPPVKPVMSVVAPLITPSTYIAAV